MSDPPPAIVVRRRDDRPVSAGQGIVSRHGLSFGVHYDPDRTSFGALVAHNDDVLDPGVAYGPHEHRDVEILTWVLAGAMVHRGPSGHEDVVGPGVVQHLVAGTGWHHDERCAGPEPVHLLQMWIAPAPDDPPPGEPSLTHVPVSGDPFTLPLRRPGVTLTVARLGAGQGWTLPAGRRRHLHVARGSLTSAGAGDAVEVTGPEPASVVAGEDGGEVLVVATR